MSETLAEEIEARVDGETVEYVVIGDAGWGGDFGLEDFEPLLPDEQRGTVMPWADARPWLDHTYDDDYGAPNLYQFCAWSASWVVFPSQYDGSTRIVRVPRNPQANAALMPGG